jgi:hypothetical protein
VQRAVDCGSARLADGCTTTSLCVVSPSTGLLRSDGTGAGRVRLRQRADADDPDADADADAVPWACGARVAAVVARVSPTWRRLDDPRVHRV